jgi:hypothetical protein
MIQKCVDQPVFLRRVLFTDEVGFTRNAVFNSRNTHIRQHKFGFSLLAFLQRFCGSVYLLLFVPLVMKVILFSTNLQIKQISEKKRLS